MHLETPEQIAQAQDIFLASMSDISVILADINKKSVRFGNIKRFGTNVLFVEPLDDEVLGCLRIITNLIRNRFYECGLLSSLKDASDWAPHATIAKTSADRRNGRKLKILEEDVIDFHRYFEEDIPVALSTIDLLSMTHPPQMDGYYQSMSSNLLLDNS
jgi:hypothetical protein